MRFNIKDRGFLREGYFADITCVDMDKTYTVNKENITPHSEAFQAIIWHCMVSHPSLKDEETKWESLK